ncbi:YggS family pyridoxal phosphate-dependent enzyme [Mycoplasmatota bacterium WC44]
MLKSELINEIRNKYPQVNIIGVTKYVDYNGIIAFRENGILDVGENRVDSFLDKYNKVEGVIWHFIGSLQTKKVKKVINYIDFLHSLDRMSLALEIEKRANKPVKCFIQVKTSTEDSKQGISIDEVDGFIKEVEKLENIQIVGFMTMAPETEDEAIINDCFKRLKSLKDKYPYKELSMGMSSDYEHAIKYDATYVRLGRLLYNERN